MNDAERHNPYEHRDALRIETLDTAHTIHALIVAHINQSNQSFADLRTEIRLLRQHNTTQDSNISAALHPDLTKLVKQQSSRTSGVIAAVVSAVALILSTFLSDIVGPVAHDIWSVLRGTDG